VVATGQGEPDREGKTQNKYLRNWRQTGRKPGRNYPERGAKLLRNSVETCRKGLGKTQKVQRYQSSKYAIAGIAKRQRLHTHTHNHRRRKAQQERFFFFGESVLWD
jgi:hypothetical protein